MTILDWVLSRRLKIGPVNPLVDPLTARFGTGSSDLVRDFQSSIGPGPLLDFRWDCTSRYCNQFLFRPWSGPRFLNLFGLDPVRSWSGTVFIRYGLGPVRS